MICLNINCIVRHQLRIRFARMVKVTISSDSVESKRMLTHERVERVCKARSFGHVEVLRKTVYEKSGI